MDSQDIELHAALNALRREKMLAKYGRAHLNNLGASYIMPNDTLKRIVDCARARKLTSVANLFRETKWDLATKLGEEVLCVVNRYPQVSRDPLQDTPVNPTDAAAAGPLAAAKRVAAPRKCSACNATGHIRTNKMCP
ncbi:hypothetical protein C2E23DRAFT_714524, partial [Lenzites betulinus]